MKESLIRKIIRESINEDAKGKNTPNTGETITDHTLYEDTEIIMDQFQAVNKALQVTWENTQLLEERIKKLEEILNSLMAGKNENQ